MECMELSIFLRFMKKIYVNEMKLLNSISHNPLKTQIEKVSKIHATQKKVPNFHSTLMIAKCMKNPILHDFTKNTNIFLYNLLKSTTYQ